MLSLRFEGIVDQMYLYIILAFVGIHWELFRHIQYECAFFIDIN